MSDVELKGYLRNHNQLVSGNKSDLLLRARGGKKARLTSEHRNADAPFDFEKRKTG